MNQTFHVPELVDPLALIFPQEVYDVLMEKLHPNLPLTKVLEEVVPMMDSDQRKFTLMRIRKVMEYCHVVEKEVEKSVKGHNKSK